MSTNSMPTNDEQFIQAALYWNLDTLYADLASAKGKRLTPVEKLHLRGLLCGYSPAEIAQKLYKSVKGLESEICITVYVYIKSLLGKQEQKIENWRNITEWLEAAGYRNSSSLRCQLKNCIPIELVGKVAHIFVNQDKIRIEIDLEPSELPTLESFPSDLNNHPDCDN
jgi:hypothetical protein